MLDRQTKWACEDGNLYTEANSIFGHYESIWTYNCPCPTGPRCQSNQQRAHICRFKQSTAGKYTVNDDVLTNKLSNEFEELVKLFSRVSVSALKTESTPIEMPVKSKEEVVPEATVPVCGPTVTGYTKYGTFRDLRERLDIQIRPKLCRHQSNCFRVDCSFAHSIADMGAAFGHSEVRHFYENEVSIRSVRHKPSKYILQVVKNIACTSSTRCSNAQLEVQIHLFDPLTGELVYPYYTILCHHCKKRRHIAVYI